MAKQVEVLTVELDADQLEKKAIKATGLLKSLKDQQKLLKKENKEGTVEYQKLTEKIGQANRINRESQKAIQDNTRAMKAASGSIQEQRSRLSVLTKQWKEQGTTTKEGKAKQAALAKEIRKTSDSLKEQESAVGNNTRNVGNYQGAIDNLAPGLGQAASKMKALTLASLRFLATPVGAVIGAIAAALLTITSYLRNTKDGVEKWDQALAVVSSTIAVVTDRVSQLGEGLLMLFSGDFSEGMEKIKTAFTDIGTEIIEEAKETVNLTKRLQTLVDLEREYSVDRAKSRKEIERLKLLAEDTQKADAERIAAARQANQLELELQQRGVELAKERVDITRAEVEMSESKVEDLEKLAQAEIELANIEEESFTRRIELNNKLNSLIAGMEAKKEKASAAEKARTEKAANEALKIEQEKQANLQELQDELFLAKLSGDELELQAAASKYDKLFLMAQKSITDEQLLRDTELELIRLQEEEETRIINGQLKKREDADKASADRQKSTNAQVQSAKLAAVQNLSNLTQGLAEENTAVAKAAAITSATASTYEGANAALAPPPLGAGPVLGPLLAGVTIAAGLANVAKIMEAKHGAVIKAKHGMKIAPDGTKRYDIGGNLHDQGGTTFFNDKGEPQFEAERGEVAVIMNRGASAALKRHSDLNESYGGVSFMKRGGVPRMADGGVALRRASSGVDGQRQMSELRKAIGELKIYTIVSEVDQGLAKARMIESRTRA